MHGDAADDFRAREFGGSVLVQLPRADDVNVHTCIGEAHRQIRQDLTGSRLVRVIEPVDEDDLARHGLIRVSKHASRIPTRG